MSADRTDQQFWRDPALPFVESRRACDSRACYRPHLHPTYSIGAVDAGTSLFTGAGDTPVVLHPGTLVFVPAGRVHACNPEPETAWSYQMLHLDAGWLQAVRAEDETRDGLAEEPVRVVTSPQTYAQFCALNRHLFSAAGAGDKEARLVEFIGDVGTAQGRCLARPDVPASLAMQIRPALDRLRDAPGESITLADLARLADMSRYQLIRAFRAVTGMTPHAWQLNWRVHLARKQMRGPAGMAQIAQHLGFADQAHFQRVFKAYAGVTPGRFRG